MVVCGNLVPLTYFGVWHLGPPKLWWCVATWAPYLMVECDNLHPSDLWLCVATWSPYLMVVCGNLVPLTYGGTWQYDPP